MPSFYRPNPGFNRELSGESGYLEGLASAAAPAGEAAKNFAPVDEGDYRDSIRVIIAGKKVYISAFDFKANWIEFGTVDTPIFSPLRRGVRAAGLRFKASSK